MGQPAEDGVMSTDLRDRGTAASANISQCQDPTLLASSRRCYFWPVNCFRGLGWACLLCVQSPRSQAVCAGSCLAAGRDKTRKAEAVRLKRGTNRGTIYHRKLAGQSESRAYLISYLPS